jgi:hypothetical protein
VGQHAGVDTNTGVFYAVYLAALRQCNIKKAEIHITYEREKIRTISRWLAEVAVVGSRTTTESQKDVLGNLPGERICLSG